jgi:hypothetical protein
LITNLYNFNIFQIINALVSIVSEIFLHFDKLYGNIDERIEQHGVLLLPLNGLSRFLMGQTVQAGHRILTNKKYVGYPKSVSNYQAVFK